MSDWSRPESYCCPPSSSLRGGFTMGGFRSSFSFQSFQRGSTGFARIGRGAGSRLPAGALDGFHPALRSIRRMGGAGPQVGPFLYESITYARSGSSA